MADNLKDAFSALGGAAPSRGRGTPMGAFARFPGFQETLPGAPNPAQPTGANAASPPNPVPYSMMRPLMAAGVTAPQMFHRVASAMGPATVRGPAPTPGAAQPAAGPMPLTQDMLNRFRAMLMRPPTGGA